MIWLGAFFAALAAVCAGWYVAYRRDQRREWPLTFADQATVDTLAAIPRPPELHHEPPWPPVPPPYRPRHGPTEPTAIWPRPPRQPMPPVLPPAYAPAVAVLGVVIAGINGARDAQRWPHLQRAWEDGTGTFAAIGAAWTESGQ